MKYKIFLTSFLLVASLLALVPKTASAFWWFGQKKTETAVVTTTPQVLSETEKVNTTAKYKSWEDSFEKKNVDLVIANSNNFSFTVPEINYLFQSQGLKNKKQTLTNLSLTSSNGNINVAANFHKFISGRFSFVAKPVSVDNKIRLQLSYVKLYGISVPTKWLEEPVNKELDKYFAFMYKDTRYQGFSFNIQDNLLQFKPEFKK